MLITQQTQAVNLVSTGSMTVELDTLESAYAKAYGEPSIDLGGVIPYVPLQSGPDILPFDTAVDVGASGGSVVPVPGYGVGGLDVRGRGGMPDGLFSVSGFFDGRQNVTTDFTLETQILAQLPGDMLTPPAPAQGYVAGLALFEQLAVDAPAILFGVVQTISGSLELAIHQREASAGVLVRKAGISLASYLGLMLRVSRVGATLTFSYSTDGGVTWSNLTASVGATASSYAVGLFVNNGSQTGGDSLNRVLFDSTVLRKGSLGYFNILNAGSALIRSQSPHQLSLDGKIDPEAENKVKGWLAVIRQRLIDAKNALMAHDNPVNEAAAGTVTEQV